MFRAQQNAFDDVVAKSTDENLTSENWEYILDVCDRVQTSDSGPKDAVAAMIKRLAHRNANVQLYTLELANALSQNCGISMHRELASRSFTDALLRLAGDRTTHQQVKSKIVERMEEWDKMFSKNPELGIMGQAYQRLKNQNPNLQPPQAPTKTRITEYDRQKEEEELQMALKLSIQDNKPAAATSSSSAAELPAATSASTPSAPISTSNALPSGSTAATVSRVRALYDFVPSEPGELQFRKGDVIAVIESVYKDWWKGSLRGQTGIFPLNYVEKLSDPTQEDLQKEAQMEAEVFGQIKNVERLLALLSTNTGDLNVRDNEEITELYQNTLAIRPKLIELIGKYTQKKDDFQQLNEKFIKARRDYEALLESSMAQSAQQYGRPPYGAPTPAYPSQHPQRHFAGDAPPQHAPQQFAPPQGQQGFQPPYPVSSPPPPSQTPGPQYPQQFQRRQSYHSEHQIQQPQEMGTSIHNYSMNDPNRAPSQQTSYPPPGAINTALPPQADAKDYYSPSVYSQSIQHLPENHTEQHQPPAQAQAPYAPQQAPPQAPSQPPPQAPSGFAPQPPYSGPPPSHAPPPPPPDRQQTPLGQTPSYSPYPPHGGSNQAPPPSQQQQYQPYQPPGQVAGGPPQGYFR